MAKRDEPTTSPYDVNEVQVSIDRVRAGADRSVSRGDPFEPMHGFVPAINAFTKVRDIHDLADAIEEAVDNVISVELMGLYLRNPETHELQLLRVKGITETERQVLEREAAQGVPRKILRYGEPMYVPDVLAETVPRKAAMSRTVDVRSRLFIPILSGTRGVGLLGFESATPYAFPQHRMGTLVAICQLAGCIYHHLATLEGLSREQSELTQRVEERTSSLERANAELERASRMKDEFLANMSHELRTPMNAVIGLTEAVLEGTYGDLSAGQTKSLNTILSSSRHLLALINDILDLAKIQAGTLEPVLAPVSLLSTCRASVQLIKEQAAKKEQEVLLEGVTDDLFVFADERHLKQILVNLLSNAVKFTPVGARIGIAITVEEPEVALCVWDEGVGIAEEHLAQLFQPFWQVDSGLARWHEGTGLGLSLVKQLSELNGGSVVVESEVGTGSRFTVQFKLSETKAYARKVSRPDLRHIQKVPISRKILLAEDNPENLDLLRNYLQARGYQVAVATDGVQALGMVQDGDVELVLMDIQMPLMDGLEVTRRIKIDPSLSHIPVVGLTALAMAGDRQKCLDAGCDAYLSKPVSLRALVETIERLATAPGGPVLVRDSRIQSQVTTPTSMTTDPDSES